MNNIEKNIINHFVIWSTWYATFATFAESEAPLDMLLPDEQNPPGHHPFYFCAFFFKFLETTFSSAVLAYKASIFSPLSIKVARFSIILSLVLSKASSICTSLSAWNGLCQSSQILSNYVNLKSLELSGWSWVTFK